MHLINKDRERGAIKVPLSLFCIWYSEDYHIAAHKPRNAYNPIDHLIGDEKDD